MQLNARLNEASSWYYLLDCLTGSVWLVPASVSLTEHEPVVVLSESKDEFGLSS